MIRATEIAHFLMRQSIQPGDTVVDATAGNGHDTLFLAECVGPLGRVFGFDVQETALRETGRLVANLSQVQLVLAGHQEMDETLTAAGIAKGQVAGIMFNLGYLPGTSKTITTRAETTLQGLEQGLSYLQVQGIVTLVCYPGHSGGAEETARILSFAERLSSDFSVSRYHRVNTIQAAPELLVIQRLRESNA